MGIRLLSSQWKNSLKVPLFFTLILASGVQDLSCAALLLDKSCIPVETDQNKSCIPVETSSRSCGSHRDTKIG